MSDGTAARNRETVVRASKRIPVALRTRKAGDERAATASTVSRSPQPYRAYGPSFRTSRQLTTSSASPSSSSHGAAGSHSPSPLGIARSSGIEG